jgi:Fe-Mn family superoxide dismutase
VTGTVFGPSATGDDRALIGAKRSFLMTDDLDRRAFGTVLAATAAAALLHDRDADAQAHRAAATNTSRALNASPAEKPIVPLPFAPASLPGLSERLLTSHHDNNYAGAVRKLNEIRQQLASADPAQAGGYWSLYGSLRAAELPARNSSLLHELYFANLAAGTHAPPALGTLVTQRFGSMDRFRAQMLGAAKSSNGWVVLVADPLSRTLEIVSTEGHALGSWEATPLLVLDMFEHAYALDYGANKGGYFDAFWNNVNWPEVHDRVTRWTRASA